MLKAVVFDLDGTLLGFDNERFGKPYICGLHKFAFEQTGIDIKTTYQLTFGLVAKMALKPDISKSNFEQFNDLLKQSIKVDDFDSLLERINDYYNSELYDNLIDTTYKKQEMIDAVKILKEKGYKLAICTNPMFPKTGIIKRVLWAGLNPDDFEFITYAENSHSLKPNLSYYEEVFKRYFSDIRYDEIMMIGNDVDEDMIVSKLDLKTYLITDYLLSRYGKENEIENKGSSLDFLNYVKEKM